MAEGVEALSALDDGSHTRRVLLLTDGQANVGIVDEPTLTRMARASAADGIGTTTIGFGDGFSEDLLASMADAGGGGAHFASTPDAASRKRMLFENRERKQRRHRPSAP